MKARRGFLLFFVTAMLCGCDVQTSIGNFRDLNKNGRFDVYEDASQPVDDRIQDLMDQMTIAEKAGLMFIYFAVVNDDATLAYQEAAGPQRRVAIERIAKQRLSHFNVGLLPGDPAVFATWQNRLQAYVEKVTRLGIPVTIASDPRHHFSRNIFTFSAKGFSQFPETLGLAAIGDLDLVSRFTDIVRQEYLAVGIRLALHPQVDLATEPRWPRINGGFGEDAHLSAAIAAAYVRGLQGNELSVNSVATMTKHFPGGGPQNEGLDPHFAFQKGQIYPGKMFDYHLLPFAAAIEAGTAAIMPYYGIPVGQTSEDVGMAFNKDIINGLLRDRYGFDGVVCADWGVITDITIGDGVMWPARAWGVEDLTRRERIKKALDAGIDQFGGEAETDQIVELVLSGQISESRIDESVRRILRQKFGLGLFDNPYVDVAQVSTSVGSAASVQLGHESQMRAMTLLKNGAGGSGRILPLGGGLKIFVDGMDPGAVTPFASVVKAPEEADMAIIRLETPWYPVETKNPYALGMHHGDLDFKGARKSKILDLSASLPTVVVIYLDRPAVIPDIVAAAAAVLADFGASDRAVAEVLFGLASPEGRLPFELPSSMEAVRNQFPDVPADSVEPLFVTGHGIRYE